MAAFRRQRGATAPSTIFTTTAKLSPRQIANKALSLGCKKLDRDDKRTRPQYNLRERLLICNTIANAEQVLNQRTRRTNRRVMSAEDDDSHFDDHALTSSIERTDTSSHHHEDTSPLRTSLDDNTNDTNNDHIIETHSSDKVPTNHFQKWDNPQMASPIIAL